MKARSVPPALRFLLVLALLGAISPAGAHPADDDRVTDQILLELAPGAAIEAVLARYDLTALDSIPEWRIWQVRVAPGDDVDEVLRSMKDDPDIASAEPHRHLESPEGVQRSIADLDFGASPETFRNQDAARLIRAPAAHARYTGAGVTVAVIDTSMALDHPETAAQILDTGADFAGGDGTAALQANGADDDADGAVDESNNHGTHIAGLVSLAAPGARVVPVRVLEEDGKGTALGVVRGILYAMRRGADVINLSFGMAHDSNYVERAIEEAERAGVVVVVAAGNRGLGQVDFPAYLPEVIAVAAVDETLVRAPFSNYGPEVALSAPGVDLLSTFGSQSYARWSGTSFAAPLVAGGAALILQKYPGLTPMEVKALLRSTAQPDANPPELQGLMGSGVLDLDALTAALTTDRSSLHVREGDQGTVLEWSPVLDAAHYDVARGEVANLRLIPGTASEEDTVDLGPLRCVANDRTLTDTADLPDADLPGPGQVFFYVFRDDAPDANGGSYGTDDDGHRRVPGAGDCPAGP